MSSSFWQRPDFAKCAKQMRLASPMPPMANGGFFSARMCLGSQGVDNRSTAGFVLLIVLGDC